MIENPSVADHFFVARHAWCVDKWFRVYFPVHEVDHLH